MPKTFNLCDTCFGKKKIPLDAHGKDWVECPMCDGLGSHEVWVQKVVPATIFTGMGMPNKKLERYSKCYTN